MTAAAAQITSVSFRGVQLLAVDANGYPTVESATEYSGLRIVGAKALTLNIPDWQRLTATGDDRVLAQFVLPAQEGVTGELRVGAFDMTAEALVSGINVKTVGEMKALPFATEQADLPDMWLLAWREAKSVVSGDAGRGHYEWVLLRAKLTPLAGEWGERATEERRYMVTAQVVSKWPWGEALVLGTDGCAEMQLAFGSAEYVPRLSAFEGDGATLAFTLVGKTAISTDKMSVYNNGTAVVAGLTKAVGSLTWAGAPTNGAKIVLFCEVAS
jgi:hypothetical protein